MVILAKSEINQIETNEQTQVESKVESSRVMTLSISSRDSIHYLPQDGGSDCVEAARTCTLDMALRDVEVSTNSHVAVCF